MANRAGESPAITSTTAPAGSRDRNQTGASPRVAAREFARLFAARGIATHPAEVRRIAGRFCADGHDLADAEAYAMTWADPTGETAIRNVRNGERVHRHG